MKIATYNVNSIRTRKDLLIEWLKREPVDILCLQELKTEEDKFPYEDLEALDYKSEVFSQKAYNGVAICSKLPMTEVRKGFGDSKWDEQKRIISAVIDGIRIINVYIPHGDMRGEEKYYYKLDFYKRLLEYLKVFSPFDKIILLGDMNVARTDLDVFDPVFLKDTIGTMREEREALEEILKLGFIDSFRHLYPERQQFTWWDYMGGGIWKNEGMRIDYILISEQLKEVLKEVKVDTWPRKRREPKPSDHTPVVAVF